MLSLFLSIAKGDQSSMVFSGVFCMVWIGMAAVTLQIKLLGGKMYDSFICSHRYWYNLLTLSQLVLPVNQHHWLHSVPPGDRGHAECFGPPHHCPHTRLYSVGRLVFSSRSQHLRWLGGGPKPSRDCGIPIVRVLRCDWMSLFHQLSWPIELLEYGTIVLCY